MTKILDITIDTTAAQIMNEIPYEDMRARAFDLLDIALECDGPAGELHKIEDVVVLWSGICGIAAMTEPGLGPCMVVTGWRAETPATAAAAWISWRDDRRG